LRLAAIVDETRDAPLVDVDVLLDLTDEVLEGSDPCCKDLSGRVSAANNRRQVRRVVEVLDLDIVMAAR
jgi:hypothetical protein